MIGPHTAIERGFTSVPVASPDFAAQLASAIRERDSIKADYLATVKDLDEANAEKAKLRSALEEIADCYMTPNAIKAKANAALVA